MKKVLLEWALVVTVCGMFVYYFIGAFEDKPFLWDAGSRTIRWKPLVESVKVSRARGVNVLAYSKSSLHISGTAGESGFAESDLFPMDESETYHFDAVIKVDESKPESSYPSLVCQFLGSDTTKPLGEITLTKSGAFHESEEHGRWQFLAGKFNAPPGTEQFKFAVVQNRESRYESSASESTDIFIEYISVMSEQQRYAQADNQRNR